jgi:chromosome segregation ATPase
MRHRAMIPPGFKQTYEPLHRELALADENYLSKQRHLAHVTDLDQRAAEQLQFRRTELQDALTELKTADEERGGELAELDQLRRELQDAHGLMQQLIETNRQLEKSLPHPTSQVTATE